MHRHIQAGLLGVIACSGASAEPVDPTISTPLLVINRDRGYAQGTFPIGEAWQGLFCSGSSCEIKNVEVDIAAGTRQDCNEDDHPLDVLMLNGDPLALFPFKKFISGNVTTWYHTLAPKHDSKQISSLRRLGKWHMPWGSRPLTISWVKTSEGMKRYHVSDGETRQFMFAIVAETNYGGDTTPIVHWAGDLDGDGKLDMLLSIPDDYCGFDERLYLSSMAEEGKLLHKAAQLSGFESACGC